jgi:thioredoxin 1
MLDLQHTTLTAVTDDTFAAAVLGADRPVIVDCWAEWCPPCHAISRSLGELAGEYTDRVAVVTLDVDENPETVRRYGVMAMPTLLVFRGGELVASTVGARPKSQLRRLFDEHAAA